MSEDRTLDDASQSTRTLQPPGSAAVPAADAAGSTAGTPHARGSSFARYLVLEYLGGGGMGVVYSAYDPQLDRKVALKLLRADLFAGERRDEAQARLLREARSLAKLSHPNVVAVHDVGIAQGQIFLAMELVPGRDVARWLRDKSPGWRRVLEVFESAGEGLAAAHRAGLLHRDFKPANVILGDDGRSRVVDFGLARSALPDPASSATDPGAELDELETPSGFGEGSSTDVVTRAGRVLGTPAYMAPEQLGRAPERATGSAGRAGVEGSAGASGSAVDPRSDQFSFCASLYQALYRKLPFPQRSPVLRLSAMLDHRIAEPPRGHGVPRGVAAILRRGLSPDPDERFESMEALLAALARQRSRRRTLALGGVALTILATLAFWGLRPGPCDGLDSRLGGVWDVARRGALAKAFETLDLPYAPALGERLAGSLDRYAEDWVTARTAACRAPLDGQQSERLTDLRTACLDRRLLELDAVVDQLLRVDAETVDRAARAPSELRPLDACSDAQALLAVVPPPDAATAERAEALYEALAEPRALLAVGRDPEAWERLVALEPRIDAVGWRAAEAEGAHLVGLVAARLDREDQALAALRRAAAAADAGGDDRQRARSLLEIAWVERRDDGVADEWVTLSRGPLERLDDARLWAFWHRTVAQIALRRGEHDLARAEAEAAVAAAASGFGRRHLSTTRMQTTLMAVLYRLGDYGAAGELLVDLLATRRAILGDEHPLVAFTLVAQAEVLRYQRRFNEAAAALEEAIAILVPTYGERHSSVAAAYASRGTLFQRRGDLDAAEADLRRAVAIRRDLLGEDDATVPSTMNALALVVWLRGDLGSAEELLRDALALSERSPSPDHQEQQIVRINLGRVLLDRGRAREALARLEIAWRETQDTLPPETDTRIDAGLAYGVALLEIAEADRGQESGVASSRSGQLGEAALVIEAAAAGLDERTAEPWLLGVARLAQARLALVSGDRAAAAALGSAARRHFEETPAASRDSHLARLDRWLGDVVTRVERPRASPGSDAGG